MTYQAFQEAKMEAYRFLDRVTVLQSAVEKSGGLSLSNFPKECGSLKRSSLDLTRALAAMRKP